MDLVAFLFMVGVLIVIFAISLGVLVGKVFPKSTSSIGVANFLCALVLLLLTLGGGSGDGVGGLMADFFILLIWCGTVLFSFIFWAAVSLSKKSPQKN